jgi:hypothetical protein
MGDLAPVMHDCSGVYTVEDASRRDKMVYHSEESDCRIERSSLNGHAKVTTWWIAHEWQKPILMAMAKPGNDVTKVHGWKMDKGVDPGGIGDNWVKDESIHFVCAPKGDLADYRPQVRLHGKQELFLKTQKKDGVFNDPGVACIPPIKSMYPADNVDASLFSPSSRGPHIDREFPAKYHIKYVSPNS